MNRTFLAGLAIAVLFGGSMTLVFLSTGQPWSTSPPPAPPFSVELPVAAPVAPAPATPAPSRAPPESGPSKARAGWNAPSADPSSPPMVDRVIRKVVRKALLAASVQSRLARCTDHVGGFGGGAASGSIPRGKPASLMLEMEALEGAVRIVDAQVQEWGEASEQIVSCARSVLRGQVIPASNVQRGERMRMPFPLNPRSETVASSSSRRSSSRWNSLTSRRPSSLASRRPRPQYRRMQRRRIER